MVVNNRGKVKLFLPLQHNQFSKPEYRTGNLEECVSSAATVAKVTALSWSAGTKDLNLLSYKQKEA